MELKRRVDAALFRHLIGNSAIPMIGSAVGCLLVASSHLQSNRNDLIVDWIYLVYATLAIRIWLSRRCRARLSSTGYDHSAANRYAMTTSLSGVAWGVGGLLIIGAPPIALVVTITAIQAMVMGSVLTLGAFIPSFLVFALPAILPMIFVLAFSGGTTNIVLAIYSAIFLALMISIAFRFNKSLRHTWQLTFEKEDFFKALSDAHDYQALLNERLELALEAAGLDFWENDLVSGNITRKANKTFIQLGYSAEEITSFVGDIFKIVHPDDVSVLKAAINDHLTNATPQYRCEVRLRAKNGTWVWFANYGKIMDRDCSNPGQRFIGVTFNIDYRKRKEKEVEIINRTLAEQNELLCRSEESLRESQVIAGLGSYVLDISTGEWKSSDILDQLFGITEVYERSTEGWESLIHPEDRPMMVDYINNDIIGQGKSFDKEFRIIRHDNKTLRWLHGLGKLEFDSKGCPQRLHGTIQDITERKKAELELRIAAIAFETQEGLMVTDVHGVIMRVNRAFTEITGYTAEEAIGQTPRLLKSDRHDKTFFSEMWKTIGRTGAWQGEIWNRRKNGEVYPERLTITAVKENAGEITHYVATLHDITERRAAEEQIYNLAFHDALTGLPNRRLLNDRLSQTMAVSKRSGYFGALMFLDLDNFKPLNDKYGHGVGDLLLIEAARRIGSCVRETDTVARFGGDEFVVMLGELEVNKAESTAQARIVAEKLRAALAEPYLLTIQQEGKAEFTVEHHCTSSIGVVIFINHEADQEDILKWADMAMYQAKEDGRNLIRFFDSQGSNEEQVLAQEGKLLRLSWHESYSCGEATIDQQHRKLFELANLLIESAFTQNENPEKFDLAWDKLLAHVVKHFADEEAMLLSHGYIDIEAHALAHKALVERALQLHNSVGGGSVTIGELVNFLANEVVAQHMLKVDRKFFPLFNGERYSQH